MVLFMKMTKAIAMYVKENNLDVDEISKDTGVPKVKLYVDSKSPLNATEMLKLCSYLKLRPEKLWEEKEGV